MDDLFFERKPPKPWRYLHPLVGSLILIFTPAVLLGLAIGFGGFDWVRETLVKQGGFPESALMGTIVALLILPAFGAGALPLIWRRRYGSSWLRGDLLTFEPGGLSIPRDEVKGWRRVPRGLILNTTFHPDNALLRPLLIPTSEEAEIAQALRWLEAIQPEPSPAAPPPDLESESAQAAQEGQSPNEPGEALPLPLVKVEGRDQLLVGVGALVLVVLLPVFGGLRFGVEAVWIAFSFGGISSTLASGIVFFCITRYGRRALATERALLVGRERVPYAELQSLAISGRGLAYQRQTPEGKESRGWTVLGEDRGAVLRSQLEELLPADERPWLGSELPAWAREAPRRGLARALIVLLFVFAFGVFSLPVAVYGQALAPFGIFKEVHLRDDDGHVLTLLYSPGEARPRFAYLASEGVMGGIAGYQVFMPGLLGDLGYGLNLGSGGREVNVAQGRIQDSAYQRPLETSSRAALRVGEGDWRSTSEPLPAALTPLALELDELPKLESLPAALAPLLAEPDCPQLIRDFVQGETSWRVHEIEDAGGNRIVAVVLRGRVRSLALLPPGQAYEVNFAILGGKTVFFRSLNHTPEPKVSGALILTKKEDSQICWPGPRGWVRAPIGNLLLEGLLGALGRVREREATCAEALREFLGSTWPEALGKALNSEGRRSDPR